MLILFDIVPFKAYLWGRNSVEVKIMDCRNIAFSPTKSEDRINRVLRVLPKGLLMRLLAFAFHLLGVRRQVIASLVGMPEESVKTVVRHVMRDGFPALRDRRRSEGLPVLRATPSPPLITASLEEEWCIVSFGEDGKSLRIPSSFQVQARTVLLSLVNAGLLSVQEAATALGIHAAHCRELARKLAGHDVPESLIDKRQGLKRDYLVTPEVKSELIQQFVVNALSGWPTSGRAIAEELQERCEIEVSERSVRLYLNKLGLSRIKETLPMLLESQKKRSSNS
jgi:transposase